MKTVRTLICKRDLETGIICLKSLIKYMDEDFKLVIHEDGSLNKEDKDILMQIFKKTDLIERQEMDDNTFTTLRNYPLCAKFRNESNYALKLFDLPIYSTDSDIHIIDSDILFFKSFNGLFNIPMNYNSKFASDFYNSYSLRYWNFLGKDKIKVLSKINVGVISVRKGFYDLDLMEWLFKKKMIKRAFSQLPYFIEQTCWSALGAEIGCVNIDISQIHNMYPKFSYDSKTIGLHFVRSYRNLINEYLPFQKPVTNEAELIKYYEAKRLDLVGFVSSKMSQKFLNKSTP